MRLARALSTVSVTIVVFFLKKSKKVEPIRKRKGNVSKRGEPSSEEQQWLWHGL